MLEKISFYDSLKTASAWALVAVALILAFVIRDILITFLVAIIFAIALDKPIDKLVDKKIPRQVAVISIYLIFLAVVSFLFYSLLPLLVKEISNFTVNMPVYLENFFQLSPDDILIISESISIAQYFQAFSQIIGTGSQNILGKVFIIFGGFTSFLVIFFVAFFLNIQKNGVRNLVVYLTPEKHLSYANHFFNKIQYNLNGWLWGKLISSIIIAIIVYLGLILIGIPYALAFAVLAMILNFIPFFGPFIACIVPAIIGFTSSFFEGSMVLVLYFVANGIIESFILMPFLMKHTINMNPILLIFFVLLGGKLAGVIGIIISIPLAAIISLVVSEFLQAKNKILEEGS